MLPFQLQPFALSDNVEDGPSEDYHHNADEDPQQGLSPHRLAAPPSIAVDLVPIIADARFLLFSCSFSPLWQRHFAAESAML